jgi:hypothetical protein
MKSVHLDSSSISVEGEYKSRQKKAKELKQNPQREKMR